MKKSILVLSLSLGLFFYSYSQENDDGLVTSHLQVNTTQDHFVSYINGFKEGIAKVKAGELTSVDAISAYYNVDITKYPSLDERLANATSGKGKEPFSPAFIMNLKNVIKKADQYTSVYDLRNEFVQIAVFGGLSVKEAETLALLDMSTQELAKSVINAPGSTLNGHAVISKGKELPKWLRCGLGAIGSAIMGAIGGAGTGAQVGALFGLVGAAGGAIIGGVLGFIGGAAVGIAKYCQ